MIFIQAVPDNIYFQWQIEVQITNFRKFGISNKMEICVWYPTKNNQLKQWDIIKEKYPEVKFFFYEDTGVDLGLYIPQLRPHVLLKHFRYNYKRLKNEVFFYHDSDIIFNYLPDFQELEKGDICWQSNTTSYLDYDYIIGKEKQGNIPDNRALKLFAKIGGITTDTIQKYNKNTGGAQVILKNIDFSFWEDVERMCVQIRKNFSHHIKGSINNIYFNSEAEGFQSWCADMWALNFALWKRKIKTQVTKDLDFSWGTSTIEVYNSMPIFHNAGVLSSNKDLFYKGAYIAKSPIGEDLPLPPENMASRMYVLAIKDVK